MTMSADRKKTANTLDSIVASITQTSSKAQNKITAALAGKLGALGTAGGIMGLLGFGTASTGTAIGSLSGAAATSAKLALLGGSVASGTAILGAATLLGGYFAATKGKKTVFGEVRNRKSFEKEEITILKICEQVSIALQFEGSITKAEFKKICETFLLPLLGDLDKFYFHDFEPSRPSSFANKTIKPYYLMKLFYHRNVLGGIVSRYC